MAASGPAPDAAAAAPALVAVTDAIVAAVGTAANLPDTPAPESIAVPAASGLEGLDRLPVLGSLGSIANRVTDGPSAARDLLASGTGRSLAVSAALLLALVTFLAVHRRADRGDRKLSSARTGPEVARFR